MTLLTIAKSIAINVSVSPPGVVMSDQDENNRKIIQFSQETADELVRRVDWTALRKTVTITGTGNNDNFDLPGDYQRLTQGMAVKTGGTPIRVGLSADEWHSLTPVVGTPRYARLMGSTMAFFPFLANGATVSVSYQSKNWTSADTTAWAADDNTALIPENLIELGAIVRWRRQLGQDFQDYMAEFEAAVKDREQFDAGLRLP